MSIARFFNDLNLRRRQRRTSIALASLSDHQLRDLGVTRHDIFAAASRR